MDRRSGEAMILLYKGLSLMSRLIRVATWSEYSHAAWLDEDDGSVWEAWRRGVRRAESPSAAHNAGTPVEMYRVAGEGPAARALIRAFMRQQEGKPYDVPGILGFVFRRPMGASQDRWFCSELVFAAYEHAGISLLRSPAYKVKPCDLAMSPLLTLAGGMLTDESGASE